MKLETQFKLRENPLYIKYLRENSFWYKKLNRYPYEFDEFIEEVKKNYKLRPEDRINKAVSTFEMISTIISTLNNR